MNYDVKIIREKISALFDLKGDSKDVEKYLKSFFKWFPKEPNTFVCENDWKLMLVGENHWVLKAPIEDEEHLISILKPEACPSSISIVLISDTLTFFSIIGPNASDIMSIAIFNSRYQSFQTKHLTKCCVFFQKFTCIYI